MHRQVFKPPGHSLSCHHEALQPSDRQPGQAHLHGLYDNGERVALAVPGQQVLADPTEGEVPAVEALEVGLACDKTLPWMDPEEEVKGEGITWQAEVHVKTGCPTPQSSQVPFPP